MSLFGPGEGDAVEVHTGWTPPNVEMSFLGGAGTGDPLPVRGMPDGLVILPLDVGVPESGRSTCTGCLVDPRCDGVVGLGQLRVGLTLLVR